MFPSVEKRFSVQRCKIELLTHKLHILARKHVFKAFTGGDSSARGRIGVLEIRLVLNFNYRQNWLVIFRAAGIENHPLLINLAIVLHRIRAVISKLQR